MSQVSWNFLGGACAARAMAVARCPASRPLGRQGAGRGRARGTRPPARGRQEGSGWREARRTGQTPHGGDEGSDAAGTPTTSGSPGRGSPPLAVGGRVRAPLAAPSYAGVPAPCLSASRRTEGGSRTARHPTAQRPGPGAGHAEGSSRTARRPRSSRTGRHTGQGSGAASAPAGSGSRRCSSSLEASGALPEPRRARAALRAAPRDPVAVPEMLVTLLG